MTLVLTVVHFIMIIMSGFKKIGVINLKIHRFYSLGGFNAKIFPINLLRILVNHFANCAHTDEYCSEFCVERSLDPFLSHLNRVLLDHYILFFLTIFRHKPEHHQILWFFKCSCSTQFCVKVFFC